MSLYNRILGDLAEAQKTEWRCFHCDEVFTDRAAAAEHFGPHQYTEPGCKIDIVEYRRMEEINRSHAKEDTELHRALAAKDAQMQTAVRTAEELGYARGLEDAKKHPELLGLMRLGSKSSENPAS